jgi:hypothetical protein
VTSRRTGRVVLSGLAAALLGASSGCLAAPDAARGWRALFDGRSLAGWRGYQQPAPPAGWKAVDGELVRMGDGGDLVSVESFGDFELAFEWQVAPGGNSGVMFHVSEAHEKPYHSGPEYQILDNDGHPDGRLPVTRAGANFAIHAPIRDMARPGAWNAARLVVRGADVEHWLNGIRIVRYTRWTDEWRARVGISKFNQWPTYGLETRGHLVLQDHGDRVAFRNLWIRTR